jgi:hypothetical protein
MGFFKTIRKMGFVVLPENYVSGRNVTKKSSVESNIFFSLSNMQVLYHEVEEREERRDRQS